MTYEADPRVDDYIDRLPAWQQEICREVREIVHDADPEVVEAAFRRLAMKYHPDTSSDPDASLRMREIIEAREVLSDPQRRLKYDRSIGFVRRTPGLRPEDI